MLESLIGMPGASMRSGVRRFALFTRLVVVLTGGLFAAWLASAALMPEGLLRRLFAGLFRAHGMDLSVGSS